MVVCPADRRQRTIESKAHTALKTCAESSRLFKGLSFVEDDF